MRPRLWLRLAGLRSAGLRLAGLCALAAVLALCALGQTGSYERTFPQSKAAIESALKNLQGSLAGRLPVLDGFANAGAHPLERYQRGYYQASVQVSAAQGGGSVVRISAKVTAWYNDPAGHSGYELLTSNGRLEADLLDQIGDQLAAGANSNTTVAASQPAKAAPAATNRQPVSSRPSGQPADGKASEPAISAPAPAFPSNQTFSTSLSHGLAEEASAGKGKADTLKAANPTQAEIENLEEIFKNQSHPKNLVAVKKSGTPVVESPSLTAKPLFMASAHDEFEILNFNADWVHVRVSGLSRGWIWRNSVEMPEGIPETAGTATNSPPAAGDLFHVTREEKAQFPGDWEPLRSKNVKIVTVQKLDDSVKDAGATARLEYAKFLFDKSYAEISQKSAGLEGIVVIFDSSDGGMIAATLATLQQWRAGKLSDSALWHKSFFDPPETFDSTGSAASQ
jgi:hypothetical protein